MAKDFYRVRCWGACNPAVPGDGCGINYNAKRIQEGDVVNDLPASQIPVLLAQGCIELVEAPDKPVKAKEDNSVE